MCIASILAMTNFFMPSFISGVQLGQSSHGSQFGKLAFEPTFLSHLPHCTK